MTPYDDLAGARAATLRVLRVLDDTDPDDLRRPSLLPGWTRAHVVAHLAGNADSHVRLLEGCLADEVRTQYAGGAPGRADGIEELAADPSAAVAAHRDACERLERCWQAMTPAPGAPGASADALWARPVHWLDAPAPSPAAQEPHSRWRELEVHGVDLDLAYRWPSDVTGWLLDELAARPDLPPLVLDPSDGSLRGSSGPVVRGTAEQLALWLSGRGDGADLTCDGGPLPVLPPWR